MDVIINKNDSEPIYLQIRAQIVAAIARGQLAPGDSLPSVRSLASDLGVNLHTVNKTYALLQDEGYVVMNGRRGTTVASLAHTASNEMKGEAKERLLASLSRLALEFQACGGSAKEFVALAEQAAQTPTKRKD